MSGLTWDGSVYLVDGDDDSPELVAQVRARSRGDTTGGPFGRDGLPCPVETTTEWMLRHGFMRRAGGTL